MEPIVSDRGEAEPIAARDQSLSMHGDRLCLYAMASAAAGLLASEILDLRFLNRFIPLALFMMLYPMMLDVEIVKAAGLLKRPGLLTMALFMNFILAPLLVFSVSWAFLPKSHPMLAVGMVVFGLIPCGGMVPAYTGAVGGNVTLSVVISAVSLFLCTGLTPLWMWVLLGRWLSFPYMQIAGYFLGVIGLPFLLADLSRRAIIARWGRETFVETRIRLRRSVSWGFMSLMFIIFSQNGKLLLENPALILEIAIPASIFIVALLVFSGSVAKLARQGGEDAEAFTVSVSVKNTAIAMAFATTSLGSEAALAIGVIGPLVQAPIMLLYLELNYRTWGGLKRRNSGWADEA